MRPLALLTVVTGIADAVAYLGLGRVFVANSTGNVVFLGFAAAGAGQVSAPASLVAIAGFLLGAFCGGRLMSSSGGERRTWLLHGLMVQMALVACATAVAIAVGHGGERRYALIAPLAIALGLQNATVRRLAVPDMTTTVLTLTLTGLASDSRWAGGTNPRWQRRTSAVALMLAGAIAGGLLVLKVGMPVALALIIALLALSAALVWQAMATPEATAQTRTGTPSRQASQS